MADIHTASRIGQLLIWLWKRVIKKQKVTLKDMEFDVSEWKRILVGSIFIVIFIICLGVILDKCGD